MESVTTLDDGVGLNVGWLSIPVKYVNDCKIGMSFYEYELIMEDMLMIVEEVCHCVFSLCFCRVFRGCLDLRGSTDYTGLKLLR